MKLVPILALSTVFSLSACVSLVRQPHYDINIVKKPAEIRVYKYHQYRAVGLAYSRPNEKKMSPVIHVKMNNRGEEKVYAAGLILPLVPIFSGDYAPMDLSENLELVIASINNPPYTIEPSLPQAPTLRSNDGSLHKPVRKMSCGARTICQTYVYEMKAGDYPEVTLLETETKLEDGSKLIIPEIKFSYRDNIEFLYHRGQ